MIYEVQDSHGCVLYEGESWPMARSALDALVLKDEGCPRLEITPKAKE